MKRVDEVKLVGFTFDAKLTFSSMVDKLAKKARCRLGALRRRLKPMLDQGNMKQMYIMFIRSIMEYGSLVYMGAAKSHLSKFDKIQASAVKLCGFEIESLESRRDAAAIGLCLDLLDGKGYGEPEGVPLVSCHRMLEPGSSCHFFSSICLFGQSDFQVSKTIFDSREILFLELLLFFWSSCYFLELLLGSSIWWRELGSAESSNDVLRS